MNEGRCDTPPVEPGLAALAVLGHADGTALAALLAPEASDKHPPRSHVRIPDVDSPHQLRATLSRHPSVREQGGRWRLEPDVAATILADLQRNDLPRYRLLHTRAVHYLADRMRAGDPAAEPVFLAVFDRLASRLLQDDPESFAGLVQAVRDVPLADAAGRQLRRYLEGVALARSDQYAEALAIFDEVLADAQLDEQVRGRALNSRAVYSRITGRLEEAAAAYRASLEIWRRLGNQLREGFALHNLGILGYELHRYDEAEKRLTEALTCFEAADSPQWAASAQNELGQVHRDQGRWAEALACFESAAARHRAEGAQDSLGRVLHNMGETLLFLGRLEEASASFKEALANMSTRVYAVNAHVNLGLVRQVVGDLPGAGEAFQEALELALAIGRREILAEVHYRLSELLRRQGENEAALAQLEAGAAVVEQTREPMREEDLKIGLLGRWQQVYEALVLRCLELGRPAAAFEWAERARARAFADAVAARSGASDESALPEWAADAATVAEVQDGLPADAALLCYFTTGVLDRDIPLLRALPVDGPLRQHLLTPARTVLFVLTRETLAAHDCPLDPNAFSSASLRGADRSRFLVPAVLRRLHAALLEPAGESLSARRLYVVPHGPLHHVPFAALTDQRGRALVDADGPELASAPSATLLLRHCLRPRPSPAPGRACLAVGHDGVAGERSLRHTEAEAAFVAGLTGGEAWVGPQPKKEQLRRAAAHRGWLHFACHGRFDDEQPLESYLQTGGEERLTALEVLRDWHLQAELVTLSACQTGVSRVLRGDEPMGLIRAFLSAGARAALVSQWPVEDLPTFLLMQRFYGELSAAAAPDPAAALREAQIWLRQLAAPQVRRLLNTLPSAIRSASDSELSGDLVTEGHPFAHPRHWAAFVLVGG